MGFCQTLVPYAVVGGQKEEKPLLVVGFTHAQTSIVLEGRLRALVQAGFRVVVISSRGELLDRLGCSDGVETIAIPLERRISPLRDVIALIRLCRLLRKLRPTITEFSTPKAGLLGNIAALLCGVPQRVYLLRGLRLETATGTKRMVLWASERVAAMCSHVVLCNSKSLLEQAEAIGIARRTKLRLLGEGSGKGVDVERFSPAARDYCRKDTSRPVIGYVGRLTRDKGIPELIEAFDRLRRIHPMAKLQLVGWFDESDDALSMPLKRYIDTHFAISHTGFVTETAQYYRNFDMLVLPTYREGFPNVALEGAASGLPLITTSATGARDAVLEGITGLVVPPGDSAALLDAMLALAAEPERARRMGAEARNWVLKTFVDKHVQALTVSFYSELCFRAQAASARVKAVGAEAPAD